MLIRSKFNGYGRDGARQLRKKDGPDNEGLNQAAQDNAALSREALDFFKTQYVAEAPNRAAATEIANKTAQQQLDIAQQNADLSKDYSDYQKNTFRPLEQGIVGDAGNYDTTARRESEAAQAITDVGDQYDAARTNMAQLAASRGVSSSSGNFLANERALAVSEGAAKASAANQARKGVELQGYARKMDAANLGRNLASSQATSAGVALNAGNSAVNSGQVPVQIGQQATAQMGQGFNTAIQGNQSAGNLYAQAGQLQNQSNESSGLFSGVGGIAQGLGAAGGVAKFFSSDENAKENIEDTSDEEALAEVSSVDASKEWDYKPGEGDGGHHTGPMAQDVQAAMGDKVAPGGKVIDLVSLNGKNMAAIKALDKRTLQVEAQVQQLNRKVSAVAARMGVAA